jgi:hypothetical protein
MGVNAAEAIYLESGKVIYPFGDVKTNTSRFPTVELRAQCGPESGDWATMTSSVHLADDTYLNVMAVAHRRGPEVHTYLSTHGLTTRGLPQRHKDDDVDADTGHLIARKSPLVLNDATTAQPKIDRGNRRRQFDLAMEKRFRAESFPFRLFITTLGICVTDTFYLDAYFNKGKEANVEWRDACRRMAWALMYNTADAIVIATPLFCTRSRRTKWMASLLMWALPHRWAVATQLKHQAVHTSPSPYFVFQDTTVRRSRGAWFAPSIRSKYL